MLPKQPNESKYDSLPVFNGDNKMTQQHYQASMKQESHLLERFLTTFMSTKPTSPTKDCSFAIAIISQNKIWQLRNSCLWFYFIKHFSIIRVLACALRIQFVLLKGFCCSWLLSVCSSNTEATTALQLKFGDTNRSNLPNY